MNHTDFNMLAPAPEQPYSRLVHVLKLLWKKFQTQTLGNKLITLFVIFITIAGIVVFYSSYIIWKIVCMLTSNVLLRALEWYLVKIDN